ncbi:MAG: amidohydrolase family protein [Desulfocapsaceae bacterium]|nr:amidohydrolase family protein [Desulfocapsaceae bacterium]
MKLNRRELLQYSILAALSFSPGLAAPGKSTQNLTKSKNIIDVHHHILPELYTKSLASIGITKTNGASFPRWNASKSIEVMDRNGIEFAITSISSPGIYFGDIGFTMELARQCNEYSASIVADYPDRFGAYAVLPLPDLKASLNELAYTLDTLNLDGVVLLSNIDGRYLGSPQFDELFAELDRRSAIVFIHPTEPANKKFPEMHIPPSFFEFLFDTTRTVASLIQYGTIERYPNIRFIIAHAGGAAPYLTWKMVLTAQRSRGDGSSVISSLGNVYYDTALATSAYPLGLVKELAGANHILFGSDSGFAPEIIVASALYELEHAKVFDQKDLQHVFSTNARQLFSRLPALVNDI